jgi:iron uptake system component EfeO
MRRLILLPVFVILFVVAGCTANNDEDAASTTINVTSTDTTCELSVTEAPKGTVTFAVQNDGSDTTEFYLYGEDGTRIIGEVEDIGPGLTRSLVVQPEPGSYVAACKPGMRGDGIRSDFVVTGSG